MCGFSNWVPFQFLDVTGRSYGENSGDPSSGALIYSVIVYNKAKNQLFLGASREGSPNDGSSPDRRHNAFRDIPLQHLR